MELLVEKLERDSKEWAAVKRVRSYNQKEFVDPRGQDPTTYLFQYNYNNSTITIMEVRGGGSLTLLNIGVNDTYNLKPKKSPQGRLRFRHA